MKNVAWMLAVAALGATSSASAQETTTTTTTSVPPATTPEAGRPVPVRDYPAETSSPVNRPLLMTSTLLFGGTYAASAIDAYVSSRPEDQKYLYIPVAGPWLDLANRDCTARPCNNEGGNTALLILDGIGQGIGAIGMVSSLFIPEKTTRTWYILGDEKVHGGPTRVGTGYGFGAGGRF